MAEGVERNIIDGLGELIRRSVACYEGERTFPSASPDRMDDRINFYAQRVKLLREIREQLENELGKPIP